MNTLNTLSVENQEFYDRTLLERELPELHYYKDGDKKVLPKGKGTSIEFRKFNSLAVPNAPLTEGVTPAGDNLNITAVHATAHQEGSFVEITDVLDMQAKDPVIAETSELLGEQSGQTVDIRVRDIVIAGTNVQYANGRATQAAVLATDKLTGDEIKKAKMRLKKMNIKTFEDGCYHMIIDANQEYDLKKDTDPASWTEVSKYAKPEQMLDGEIGKYDGVRIMVTSNTPTEDVSGVTIHKALMYGRHAYGVVDVERGKGKSSIIVKPLGSSGTSDPLNQRSTIGWKKFFTAVRLNELGLCRIETGATE